MIMFSGELPRTVVLLCSEGSPARAKVKAAVSVFREPDGTNLHFLRAVTTCSEKAVPPDSIATLTVPEVSTTSFAVTVPCFLALRAGAG